MKTPHRLTVACALLLSGAPLPFRAHAQDGASDTTAERRLLAELAAAAASPGEEHERLSALAGEWRQTVRVWPAPGAEAVVMEGRARNEMILGGRFLKTEARAGEGPLGSESLLLTGFDRRSGRYTQVGFDTWGTYYVTAAGPFDAQRGVIVLSGEDHDPLLGSTQVYDFVLRFVDDDTYVSEIIFKDPEHTGGAEEFKMVEITAERVR